MPIRAAWDSFVISLMIWKISLNWSEPIKCFEAPKGFGNTENFWAPEVHYYNDWFYMFASFIAKGHLRAVDVTVNDKPTIPYGNVGEVKSFCYGTERQLAECEYFKTVKLDLTAKRR